MNPVVANNLNTIAALCRRFGVRRLEVFGSAARDDFDPVSSDIDLIVDFLDYGPGVADRFFGLSETLEALFERDVDFVFARKLKNPYFVKSVNEHRRVIYESRDGEIAA